MPKSYKISTMSQVKTWRRCETLCQHSREILCYVYRVILEVEWEGNYCVPLVERLLPVYHKTDVSGLQTFLRENFATWASNGSCVEEIWRNFKGIVHESVERFVPHKSLKNPRTPNTKTRKLNN